MKGIALFFMISMFLLIPLSANAMECPTWLLKARTQIEVVKEKIIAMKMKDTQLAQAMLDEADSHYQAANHSHSKGSKDKDNYGHAISIAKAQAAYGYAYAAEALLNSM